jgi:type IV pilus biogenesis protein CpaD/CtpE
MKTLLCLALLLLAGCATPPAQPPRDTLPIYRPTQPIVYPLPR